VSEKTNSAVPVPELQRRRLVFALTMWPLDFEDRVAGRNDMRDVRIGEGLL